VHKNAIQAISPGFYTRAELESWAAGLHPDGYAHAMTHRGETFLVAELASCRDSLIGFCSFGAAEIIALYVNPDWQGRRIATALLAKAENVIASARHECIHVGASLAGLPFYARQGYREIRRRGWKTRGGLVVEIVDMEKLVPRARVVTPAARAPGRRP
jgi:GNAT superfamily N-acetyltransferase